MSRPIRSSRRTSWRALPLALAVGLLTACSGTTDTAAPTSAPAPSTSAAESSPGPASSEAPEETGGTLTVTGVDFDYELTSTDLSAGEYEIEFVNDGGASHDVRVERDGADVAASEVIPPGETSSFSVTLEPGEYIFYCSVGNHRDMGMEVQVTVT